MRTVHQNSKPEVSKLLKMLEKGDFTHYYHLHGNVSDNQPRSQGFSLRKWEGPGRSPGDEVVRQPLPRPLNCIYLQQSGYISCQFIYVHLFIYTYFFSAIFIFYLFISFNCLKIIIIFHVPCFGSNFLFFVRFTFAVKRESSI